MDRRLMHAYESAAAGALARPCGIPVVMPGMWHLGAPNSSVATNRKRQFGTASARPPGGSLD